jgi:hypothetical protein
LVKKLTVMGSSGKMHGIMMAAKPPAKPAKNVTHSDVSAGAGRGGAGATVVPAAWPAGVGATELAVAGVAVSGWAVAAAGAFAAGAGASMGVKSISAVETVSCARAGSPLSSPRVSHQPRSQAAWLLRQKPNAPKGLQIFIRALT